MKYILILLLVCSCSNLSEEDKYRRQEVNNILIMFEQDYSTMSTVGRVRDHIRYSFGNLDSIGKDIAGVCWIIDGNRFIIYDLELWDKLSDIEKINLVYHEQGHCLLDREHRCSLYDNKYSLMFPYLLDKEYLDQHFDYIKKELFLKEYQPIDDCEDESDNIKGRHNEKIHGIIYSNATVSM